MFWACVQLQTNRERLALHCLGIAGFQTYMPRLRVTRRTPTRKVMESTPALFPGYCFVWIELQWHEARWQPGVIRVVLHGEQPARVPEAVIDEIRSRERDGLVELPKPPPVSRLKLGTRVRIQEGPMTGCIGLLAALRPHERVMVLLQMLGGQRRVELSQDVIRAIGVGQ
jgi:transcriptional antiterminator RfaH